MKHIIYFLVATLFLAFFVTSTQAQIPRVISYQGMLLGSNEQPVPKEV